MAVAVQNPTALSNATTFRPKHGRAHSRSPSRSPIRKAQFVARELDPLLSNLTPDSTLRALQETETISRGGTGQDALARSIEDASTSERELGIRAALAAQKLKQWKQEIIQWSWPKGNARATGAGFNLPLEPAHGVSYFGCLPSHLIQQYEDRLEEIRDSIESLGLEDVKEYVFSAHVPMKSSQTPSEPVSVTKSNYGRMRDFTALITATVVQALPDLAEVNRLLDTWDIRLTVLRQVPSIYAHIESTRAGIRTASRVIHDVETGPLVKDHEVQTTKAILGNKVSSLGARVDKLLDMLEGEEDALPQSWIDSLEDIEEKYANWVVEAEKTVARNQAAGVKEAIEADTAVKKSMIHELPGSTPMLTEEHETPSVIVSTLTSEPEKQSFKEDGGTVSEQAGKRKPMLEINTSASSNHRRGPSEVSMASNLSGYSLENAEIVDARTTQVLASPKISVVDNPFRASKDLSSWFGSNDKKSLSPPRPTMVQRASAASIEVINKDQIKKVDLRRSWSHDMLAQMAQAGSGTPNAALKQLTGQASSDRAYILDRRKSTGAILSSSYLPGQVSTSDFPSVPSDNHQLPREDVPAIPRRSSKRNTFHGMISPTTPKSDSGSPVRLAAPANTPASLLTGSPMKEKGTDNLQDRIRDILISLPNKIRLADESERNDSGDETSQPPTRSSSPVATLKLSPAKDSKSKRDSTGGIRVYHLSKSGQKRDTPPIKLFVRAVGENGERVMVRVGGGWADLAEYLREYSLHHGGRNLTDGALEVASFPEKQSLQPVPFPNLTDALRVSAPQVGNSKVKTIKNGDMPASEGLNIPKTRGSIKSKASDENLSDSTMEQSWTPPPVPPIPAFYTVQSPTTINQVTARGKSRTSILSPVTPSSSGGIQTSSSTRRQGTMTTTLTTIQSPSVTTNTYTPLGAAGPKSNSRRAVSHGATQSVVSEKSVENIVKKARAVSGNYTYTPPVTSNHAATTNVSSSTPMVTTTTVTAKTTPNRRASAFVTLTPSKNLDNSSRRSISAISLNSVSKNSAISTDPSVPKDKNKDKNGDETPSSTSSRRKSRMSFGDMGGIKRVFLRKKSEK